MSRSQRAQLWQTAALLGGGVLLVSFFLLLAWVTAAVLAMLGAAVLAWAAAPRRRAASSSHWDAQERLVREGRPIVYWRPGCLFCSRLRFSLGETARAATWVDIWSDPEAAAFVRDVNGGAETVPTVILPDGEARTNPAPADVRHHFRTLGEAA